MLTRGPCGSVPFLHKPVFHSPPGQKTRFPLSQTQCGFLCPGWGWGRAAVSFSDSLCPHHQLQKQSERRKTPSERLPKYPSAVPSPREERFRSPAEAAVNKHSACFISHHGCPLLSTNLTWAPRWERSQEPQAHQQQTVPPHRSWSGAASRSCPREAMADVPGRSPCPAHHRGERQRGSLSWHSTTVSWQNGHLAQHRLSGASDQPVPGAEAMQRGFLNIFFSC